MILLGFATLMTGMSAMSDAVSGLKDDPDFTRILTLFSNPVLGVLAGAVLTAIIQSSSASVGILQALAQTGIIPISTAIPIILGQNIGTTITPILSSISGNTDSKRVALACLYIKMLGVFVVGICEHLENLKKAGVRGLMLSWTLGGYPGGNLELLDHTPEECAAMRFSPENAALVCKAWRLFSDGFRNFPFNVSVVYSYPGNAGPKNQLYLKSTGYHATMVGFPYDDLRSWRGIYPEDINEFYDIVYMKNIKEKIYQI